jgi:ATP-dependent Clp protease protease subunit
MKDRKFWKWTNQADADPSAERVLELYGTIASETWFDDDITPQMFKDELLAGSGPITIWVNSPGGDCTAASQIYSMLMDYKNNVTVKIDGIAASAASVIAMAGTRVLMAPTAMMMIHNPATGAFGDHVDMEKAIEMLDEVKESIINAYEIKTGLSHTQLSHMMDETTWMNAKKAIELGFADGLLTDEKHNTESEAYAFSGSSVEKALLNRISAKAKQQTPRKKSGTVKADDCLARLNLIKNWR